MNSSPKAPASRKEQRLKSLQAQAQQQGELLSPEQAPADTTPTPGAPVEKAPSSMRKKPRGDHQGDFFTPALYDVGARDNRGVMDVAVFRLSKRDKRANSVIRYELPDGFVEVTSGVHGMASVWDYDIVLMAISHLTDAMNRYRDGKGEKPVQVFRPHIADVLKFCRKDNGGHQKDAVVGALQRLSTTHVVIERTKSLKGKPVTITEGENLIGPFKVISSTATKKVEFVEIKIADWMFQEVTQGTRPDVLTVHPDYFLIDPALGRFLYRLARKAAGKDSATWGFKTLFARSGSAGTLKEFNRMLREIIAANDLPEYHLVEEEGVAGPMLVMIHRGALDKLKEK